MRRLRKNKPCRGCGVLYARRIGVGRWDTDRLFLRFGCQCGHSWQEFQ